MGYALAGWVEFVVEVQWVVDDSADFGAFIAGLGETEPLAMCLELQTTVTGGSPLGAMVEGQMYNAHHVRFAGPAGMVGPSMAHLEELCRRVFPRQQ